MTKQAELKKQAYASNLKSRALSILIYLIDRSNKDLTCFPAIPTMAEQLHISVSTVKRALHELVDAGYIQKDSRFREKNRGQTSNLYTLVLFETAPTPDYENNLDHEDTIKSTVSQTAPVKKAEHISFETLKAQNQTQPSEVTEESPVQTPSAPQILHRPPVHRLPLGKLTAHDLLHHAEENPLFSPWTGAGFNLIPP